MKSPDVQAIVPSCTPARMRRLVLVAWWGTALATAGAPRGVSGGGGRRSSVSAAAASVVCEKNLAVEELKRLVPPPSLAGARKELGDEHANDATYRRFLSVVDWDPAKAAPKLEKDFKWRKKVQPHFVRPAHCPILCRQRAWQVLTKPRMQLAGPSANTSRAGAPKQQLPLHPPHSCPPMQSWRRTKQGMPITLFECRRWRPDLASKDEQARHTAYHMEHSIRRMPSPEVQRVCVVMDMEGFQSWMLPYVKGAIDVLRNHYPGRAGAMCMINIPAYFRPIWKIISPWLDEEIRGKTFFAPASVDDVEKAIDWVGKKSLKVGAV